MILQLTFGTPLYHQAYSLRHELLRKPLGRKFDLEDIQEEWRYIHIGFIDAHWQVRGCLTLVPTDKNSFKMRQVCVDQECQGRGMGKKLIFAAEQYARDQGIQTIHLHARDTVLEFYKKLGYEIDGEGFLEVGIPHHRMLKSL